MAKVTLFVLLLVGAAVDEDAEVAKWVARIGDPANPGDFEPSRKLIELGNRSIPACHMLLLDRKETPLRRMRAAQVLGGVRAKVAVRDLLACVEDRHWWVAVTSATALGQIGDPSALPDLARLLEQAEHASVREAIEESIELLRSCEVPDFGWIPWAETIEEARARAAKENRIVLAVVTPWDWWHHESGYEGAEKVHGEGVPYEGDAERLRRTEPGAVKERAILTALLCHPELAALVADRFVPVRVHMHTGHFRYRTTRGWADPLERLGTTVKETRPPALVFASPDGALLHSVARMGTFSPHLTYRTCLAVLAKTRRQAAEETVPTGPRFQATIERWIRSGNFRSAREHLQTAPGWLRNWAALARARMLLLEGNLDSAEKALLAIRQKTALGNALLGEVYLLTDRTKEARDLLAATEAPKGDLRHRIESGLALAEERLGNRDRARVLWEGVAERAGDGPWATRAKLHLDRNGPFPREWETYRHLEVDALTPTTERGGQSVPVRAAVDYLLSQQQPDGSWPNAHNRQGLVSHDGRPLGEIVPRTALCVSALRAVRGGLHPSLGDRTDAAIRKGIRFVTAWSENPERKVWQLTYALHLDLSLLRDGEPTASRTRIAKLLAALAEIELDGGWTYAVKPQRRHTFNTAPILILLREAKRLRVDVDDAMIQRATKFLEANRVGNLSVFHYGTTMEHLTEPKSPKRDSSSCMRGPLCELALHDDSKESERRIAKALDIFFEHVEGVRATARIYESWVEFDTFQDSYRYYFGTYYAARAIRLLPRAARTDLAGKLTARILRDQEIDGSFVDSQMIGKTSSTALALLTLAELR
jgi:hypothetical protein